MQIARLRKLAGMVETIGYLAKRIAESGYCDGFAADFLAVWQAKADYSMIWPRFSLWLLTDEKCGVLRLAKSQRAKDAINGVAALYARWIDSGKKPDVKEWRKVRTAADAAAAAAAYADAAAAAAYAAAYADAAAADAAAAAAAYAAYAAAAYAAAAAAAAAAPTPPLENSTGRRWQPSSSSWSRRWASENCTLTPPAKGHTATDAFNLGMSEPGDAFGMTYDNDPRSPRSVAYDMGRNVGEALAELSDKQLSPEWRAFIAQSCAHSAGQGGMS